MQILRGVVCFEFSIGIQVQGVEKNCYCCIINNSGEVTVQDCLFYWILNIYVDNIERERKIFFYLFFVYYIFFFYFGYLNYILVFIVEIWKEI